jgi:hypothetical protein
MEAGARGGHQGRDKNPFYELELFVGIAGLPLVGVEGVVKLANFERSCLTEGGLLMEDAEQAQRNAEKNPNKREFAEGAEETCAGATEG